MKSMLHRLLIAKDTWDFTSVITGSQVVNFDGNIIDRDVKGESSFMIRDSHTELLAGGGKSLSDTPAIQGIRHACDSNVEN